MTEVHTPSVLESHKSFWNFKRTWQRSHHTSTTFYILFPGLKDGDQWCVCAASWRQAYNEGKACKIHLESTHYSTLRIVPLEELMEYSLSETE